MKKKLVSSLLILLSVLCCKEGYAQYAPPTFALHISSPTGMLYKLGLKAEYRIYSENALLLSYTSYWQYYPGWQAALEYRIYFHTNTLTENLVYCKIGSGFADYERSDLYDTKTSLNRAPGTYYFGGGGVGRHWNYGVFFMELCAGLKFAYVTNPPALYNERIFYTLGPGSFPDVHFNFGIQL